MNIVANPRLIDVFGCSFNQDQVDFAIPRLQEDIPLYIDPFLMWISGRTEIQELHHKLLHFFSFVRDQIVNKKIHKAAELLAGCKEPNEIGLGYGARRRGSSIGPKLITDIIEAYSNIPQLYDNKLRHIEELQLVVPNIAEDRICDIAVSILKDYFIQYTEAKAKQYEMPVRRFSVGNIFDFERNMWIPAPLANLPFNPLDNSPLLLAQLNLLRHLPWINYLDYYRNSYVYHVAMADSKRRAVAKAAVLTFNSRNYVEVEQYVVEKERQSTKCLPDPLFTPFTPATLQSKYQELRGLATGSHNGADRKYEDLIYDLLVSLLYPVLEFAESRVRTISGAHIRDILFYNDGKTNFWADLRDRYDARQPVLELKNVKALEAEHVNQLYRYLDGESGRFGMLVTRNPTPASVQRNIVDLHSSKNVAIICVDDRDIELMLSLSGSSRHPSDAIKKKYLDFTRLLPK